MSDGRLDRGFHFALFVAVVVVDEEEEETCERRAPENMTLR